MKQGQNLKVRLKNSTVQLFFISHRCCNFLRIIFFKTTCVYHIYYVRLTGTLFFSGDPTILILIRLTSHLTSYFDWFQTLAILLNTACLFKMGCLTFINLGVGTAWIPFYMAWMVKTCTRCPFSKQNFMNLAYFE